jgi:hypothetical protein
MVITGFGGCSQSLLPQTMSDLTLNQQIFRVCNLKAVMP